MRKKISLFLIVGMLGLNVFAQSVDFATAKQIAENYRKQNDPEQNNNVSGSYTQKIDGDTVFYIFNYSKGGFVIISAEQKTHPIIAYSFTNSFDLKNQNPAVRDFLGTYGEKIAHIQKYNIAADKRINQEWKNLKEGKAIFTNKSNSYVKPLLTSTWDQNIYYNTNCPEDDKGQAGTASYDHHVPVGCVALSMAQIIYYHRHPINGSGHSSYSSSYGKLSANYSQTSYDYNSMSDVANGYCNAIAQLIYHCGVSTEMGYDANGSGSSTENVLNSLRKYFKYSTSIQYVERINYTDSAWIALLKENLDNRMPMVYSGSPDAGGTGHAWNCDGYDNNDYFHMNWGWGGISNGYFNISNLTNLPIEFKNLNSNHRVVCHIKPQNFTSKTNDTLTAIYGSFADGSGYLQYENNQNRSWLIKPDNVTSISLKCSMFSTDTNDIVTVYNGTSTSDSILATYSGNFVEGDTLTINKPAVLITFKSDSGKTSEGFLFTYTTTLKDLAYCNTTQVVNNSHKITKPNGVINNGSGDNNYADGNTCYWRVEPRDAYPTQIWISFDKFDLGEGDELTVYNYDKFNPQITNSTMYVVDKFNKQNPPEIDKIYEYPKSYMYLRFRTDNNLSAKGWSMNYGINLDVKTYSNGINEFNIYPNPAQNLVNVSLSLYQNENVLIQLVDMYGRVLYKESHNNVKDRINCQINTSDLAAGMYIINVSTSKGKTSKKIQLVK